jgi:hypothetical protein
VASCCECGDEPSGSCTTEVVIISNKILIKLVTLEFACGDETAVIRWVRLG